MIAPSTKPSRAPSHINLKAAPAYVASSRCLQASLKEGWKKSPHEDRRGHGVCMWWKHGAGSGQEGRCGEGVFATAVDVEPEDGNKPT